MSIPLRCMLLMLFSTLWVIISTRILSHRFRRRLTMSNTSKLEMKEPLQIGIETCLEEKSNTLNSPILDKFIVLIRLLLVLVSTTILLVQTFTAIYPIGPLDFMALAVSSLGLYEGVTNG